jgi:hypothetical protein
MTTAAVYEKQNLHREFSLQHSYGISVREYNAMLEAQGGLCSICGRPPRKRRLAVDHDHVTGKIRGLLCTCCNLAAGYAETGGVPLAALSAYLSFHNGPGFQIPDNRPVLDHSSSRYLYPPTPRGHNPRPRPT